MFRALEALVCLALAAALHLAVFLRLPEGGSLDGAPRAEVTAITLPSADLAALVAAWQAPPEVTEAPDPAPTAGQSEDMPLAALPMIADRPPTRTDPRLAVPTLPVGPAAPPPMVALAVPPKSPTPRALPLPGAVPDSPALPPPPPGPPGRTAAPPAPPPPVAEAPPVRAASPAPPASALAVERSERPRARVERHQTAAPVAPQASPTAAPQRQPPAQQARGGSQAQTPAQSGAATRQQAPRPPQLSAGQRQSLIAGWGGQIATQIQRRARSGQGSGRVVIRLTVARNGRLEAVAVAQSSGNASLDKAALAAARAAGRFPAAPRQLTEARYSFNLPIRFR